MTTSICDIEKLRFENLTFGFDGQEPLFQKVDFDFPMDQLVWVKAEHGQGRSTLLQILAALQNPLQGSYWINDFNVNDMTFEEFLPFRLQIGYGFDTGGLIHNRTIFENLMLPISYHKILQGSEAKERVGFYLREFGLWKYKDQRPSYVPGGTRKMACLVRALILHPQMLLLDDPTVGIPQEMALKFFDHLQELRNQNSLRHIYVSSFDEKFMNLVEHQEIFIDNGLLHGNTGPVEKKVVSL